MLNDDRKNRYFDKLESLKRYSTLFLNWFHVSSLEEIKKNNDIQKIFAIYHAVQLSVETILDLAAMIAKDSNYKAKDSYSNIENLKKLGIIVETELEQLRQIIGLRNRLTHDYNGIIDEVAWNALQKNSSIFNVIRSKILEWIKQN
jgi:uncharacterized protein YutE (UPF0331/DUF86 family)